MHEIIFASAATIARSIREREVSSSEITAACLERITAVNPQLNAVVQLAAESALERAGQADEALARGESWGPLHGVPFTIKDSLDTAGMVSSWGTPGRAQTVPEEDATVVARLRKAGAILLGKTNTPEFTLSYETDNPIYGRTNNPYNRDLSPGGSSGGAAALVAAGGSPFDIGSDTGGSIRLPAHLCGIAGLKPTSGRVPRTGHAIPPGGLLDSLTQLGPMARFVEDVVLLLPLIAGPDGRDPAIVPVPLANPQALALKGLRAAFHTDNGIQSPVPEVEEAVLAAVEALSEAGVLFREAWPEGIEETHEISSPLFRGWDGGAWVRLLLQRAGTAEADSSLGRYLKAGTMGPDELVELLDRWDRFRSRLLAFMEDTELIVCPAAAYVALPHGQFQALYPGFSYTMTYNLTGWPAAVVRVGTSAEGQPIGVQLVARPWREDVCLAAARHLETVLGGWQPPLI